MYAVTSIHIIAIGYNIIKQKIHKFKNTNSLKKSVLAEHLIV